MVLKSNFNRLLMIQAAESSRKESCSSRFSYKLVLLIDIGATNLFVRM